MEYKDQIPRMCIPENSTIRHALAAIDAGAMGIVFLVEQATGRFTGLATDGDIRRGLLQGLGLNSPISKVMRPEPKVGRIGMNTDEVARLFSAPVRVVPLLDDEARVADLAVFDLRIHLPVAEPQLGEKELQYVSECVLTGWVSSAGQFITRFENLFAEFTGVRHAIATSNGTTALHLSLLALDVGPGDEVIVPSLTFIASANAVRYTGATPVFVDSEAETWNLDPREVERAITDRTRAIIPVHLYGHPADMDPLRDLAEEHGLAIVEDAAEAHGARYRGHRVGSIGDLGVFSFYGNKIITTGEGGMITTNSDELARKIRILRDHGMSPERRYWHPVLGYNYRMTNIQAAIGLAQLERIDAILGAKDRLAKAYSQGLADVPGLTLPPRASWADPVCWLYSILVDEEQFGVGRDELMRLLREQSIDTRPIFIPAHQQPIYDTGQMLPCCESLAERGLSLPSSTNLRESDVALVVESIRDAHERAVVRPLEV